MPTDIAVRPVVAGVDGSPASLAAAHYAADFAARHQTPLHLIYGYEIPMYGYLPQGMVTRYAVQDDRVRDEVGDVLAATAKQLRADHRELTEVQVEMVAGGGASVLIEASRTAAVTVVGCRGIGGFSGLLLGSVSAQVSAHAHGPVIVVRPPIPDIPPGPEYPGYHVPSGPVVVGVDRSPAAHAALRFAFDEADQREVPLIAVHAYRAPSSGDADTFDQTYAESLLAAAVLPFANRYPGVHVEMRTQEGANVEKTMIDITRHAGLVVVGCRGTGGFAGLLLGSVSRALVHHAYAPVAVIHPTEY
jgi:nucleotide-binding universal stress UspA family protein